MISPLRVEGARPLRARLLSDPRWMVWLLAAVAWLVALGLTIVGPGLADHRVLDATGGLSTSGVLGFLTGWQIMIAATMLPTTIPMVQYFGRASLDQPNGRSALFVFLLAYVLLWTAFGITALILDSGLHWLAWQAPWLAERGWILAGSTLMLAGAFQFSPIKDRCLRECRHPMSFMLHYYRRGYRPAFEIGIRQGLHCLGCCWALMLVMFGVGVGNLAWMAAIAGIMLLEKTSRMGRRLVPYVGGALICCGLLVLVRGAVTN
jgi:predicted metal-binding membrane protein